MLGYDSAIRIWKVELRNLLSTCFLKPEDTVFKEQRYFKEPYRHRWLIRGENGEMVAHVGVHEKRIEAEGVVYRIAGLAEVCVHPSFRGRGCVRAMMTCVHSWICEARVPFSVLFGDPGVYGPSGYVKVDNLKHGGGEEGWTLTSNAMVREMTQVPWPSFCNVHLPGPKF